MVISLRTPTTRAHLPPQRPSPNPSHTIAFTTPSNYASRLSGLISLKGYTPLWCPTVTIGCTPDTISLLKAYLLPASSPPLNDFSAIAFTSRSGITAFSKALGDQPAPPLKQSIEHFTLAALGKDAELLDEEFIRKLCNHPERIRVLSPETATPDGLVEELGFGDGRRILCPVPLVVGLEEPPVVPNFLRDLRLNGWEAVRVCAYETRWAGADCARGLVERLERGAVGAIVFTSTAEVEGLLKGLRELGLVWEMVRGKWAELVVATHGPVTAAGARRLGVEVDVVSSRFESFNGVVEDVDLKLRGDLG